MSYCRWSSSEWYIFWQSMGPSDDLAPKEDQTLAVWYAVDALNTYTYQQVKHMLAEGTYTEVPGYGDCGKYGRRDLLDAFEEFCLDVESATDIQWRNGEPSPIQALDSAGAVWAQPSDLPPEVVPDSLPPSQVDGEPTF